MKKWQLILILVAIFALSAYLVWAAGWIRPQTDGLKCKHVLIDVVDSSDNQFVSTRLVRRILQENQIQPVGKELSKIELRKIENLIQSNAMVKRVVCYRTPTGDLKIRVWQRVPEFKVMSNSGETYYVDNQREVMPVSILSTAYVPVVTGFVTKDFAKKELYDFVLYTKNDNFLDAQIEQIYVYPDKNIELIPRVGSQVIFMGQVSRYQAKFDKLKTFYKKVMPKVGWNYYSRINLAYKDQVVCTKN